ncbi:helix-turn-helix domain-containing protein, partial [Comamonas thiooxydans]
SAEDLACPVAPEATPVAEAQPLATLREHSAQLIRETLDQHGGNVSQAARALGISRGTLYRRLRGGRD